MPSSRWSGLGMSRPREGPSHEPSRHLVGRLWVVSIMGLFAAVAILVFVWWRPSLSLIISVLLGICALVGLVLWWSERQSEAVWEQKLDAWRKQRRRGGG